MIASLVWELLGSAGQFWVERNQQSRAVERVPAQLGVHLLYCWIPPSFVGTMNVKRTRPWHRKLISRRCRISCRHFFHPCPLSGQTLEGDSLSRTVYPAPPSHSHIFSRLGHSRPGHRGNGAAEKSASCLQPHQCQGTSDAQPPRQYSVWSSHYPPLRQSSQDLT